MQTENSTPFEFIDESWTVRILPPALQGGSRSILLLHGLTGDETVMWIFSRNLPRDAWLFAPRAPHAAPGGGYRWITSAGDWPALDDFSVSAANLKEAYARWAAKLGAPAQVYDVMGFSQGAALAYALAALHPQQVRRVITLAGFLPTEDSFPGRYSRLEGKKVYIAHGSQDRTIPVEKARQAVSVLESAGCQVTYCESDVGHKLSASCLRGLNDFTAS